MQCLVQNGCPIYNFTLINKPGTFEADYKRINEPNFSWIDFYDLGTFALILCYWTSTVTDAWKDDRMRIFYCCKETLSAAGEYVVYSGTSI